MPSVNFYFQVHQPWRIRRYSYFETAGEFDYFDEKSNGEVLRKVASKSYLPANELMLKLIERYDGAFRIAYSITGAAIEQFERYSPETLRSFQRLAETGHVEFLGETYYHSLSSLHDPAEFETQVNLHDALMRQYFGYKPKVFRNTELIYDDRIGRLAAGMGYKGVIAEGADDILEWRTPNHIYRVPETNVSLLLKNYRLSDDIAFRFSDRHWNEHPLTSDKFARWLHRISGAGEVVNLFMDYETFGEHQWESTGIFAFLEHLPEAVFRHPDWDFVTPSEAVERYAPRADLSFHRTTSWADVDRDLTAWRGNRMQKKALDAIYALGDLARRSENPEAVRAWRRLQTSDHFYYMCTKWFADGDVHAYFSPFETPYDAFLNYANVITDLKRRLSREHSPEETDQADVAVPHAVRLATTK